LKIVRPILKTLQCHYCFIGAQDEIRFLLSRAAQIYILGAQTFLLLPAAAENGHVI